MPDWRICRIAGAGARRRSRDSARELIGRRSLRRAARRLSLARARATSTSPRSAARAGRASDPTRSRSASRHEDGARTDFSYGELDRDRRTGSPRRCAGSASSRGDRVALVMPQRFETAVAHIALYQLGAVAMPLSMLFGPDALEYRINDSERALGDRRRERHRQRARRRAPLCPQLATRDRGRRCRRAGRSSTGARAGCAKRATSSPRSTTLPTTPPCSSTPAARPARRRAR